MYNCIQNIMSIICGFAQHIEHLFKQFANTINSNTATLLTSTKTNNIKEVNMYMCSLSIGLSLLCSKIFLLCFLAFPNFLPIMLVFMLFRNALCFYFVCFFFVHRSSSYDTMKMEKCHFNCNIQIIAIA